jgi:hypothetical protein
MNTRIVYFLYLLLLIAKVYGQGQVNLNSTTPQTINWTSPANDGVLV